jgi:hypothetical protein
MVLVRVRCCYYYPLDLGAGGTVPRRNPGVAYLATTSTTL